jgi:hypothetical protein
MGYLGNVPGQATMLRVEARKSFALGLWLKEPSGRAVNITGSTITIVAKPKPFDNEDDVANIFGADATAIISVPTQGYARFEIQASTLDYAAGEYEYAIVLQASSGYSSVIVMGTLEIVDNPEVTSTLTDFVAANPSQTLNVLLQDSNSINVVVGAQLPPGMNYVSDEVVEILNGFDPDAVAMVPEGGTGGYVLTKTSADDYSMAWLPVGNGAFALDATGQPAGYVPAAVGDDTWIWSAVGIDASGVTAGYVPVANGDGTWSWAEVDTAEPDWNATSGQPGFINNKPDLAFYDDDTLVSEMEGFHVVTSVPSSYTDGHLYFVYTP